jgi:23S rRNA (cytidine2498-2'-O)-methyltransferase
VKRRRDDRGRKQPAHKDERKPERKPAHKHAHKPGQKPAHKPGQKPAHKPGHKPAHKSERQQRHQRSFEARHERVKSQNVPTERRTFPEVTLRLQAPPRPGEWLLTTRPGSELDLIEELTFTSQKAEPRPAGPSLVATPVMPFREHRPVELAFARQAFLVSHVGVADVPTLARALEHALRKTGAPQAWAIDGWTPDADATNPLAPEAERLAAAVGAAISRDWGDKRVPDARAALGENGHYAQLCVMPTWVAIGVGPARDAPSLAPGGRLRVRVPESAPSRAAMKLAEAFLWLDRAPERGDVCVDLGAAPGGWSWVLLEHGAKVYAVDPAKMSSMLQSNKNFTHLRSDAFLFDPGEPVDWLFSDMAWRPLESAALLAKWARRRWARLVIANIKLPMKKKAEMLVRVREILTDGGWTNIRMRQLYHDREEVTIAGVRI